MGLAMGDSWRGLSLAGLFPGRSVPVLNKVEGQWGTKWPFLLCGMIAKEWPTGAGRWKVEGRTMVNQTTSGHRMYSGIEQGELV